MVVVENKYGKRSILISKYERYILHTDLMEAFMAGGRNLIINYKKDLVNYVTVYDDHKNKVCKIVGTSAILLSEILGKSEDNVFMSVPISIQSVIAEYCSE